MSPRKAPEDADKIKGSIKEAIGKLVGDGKVETEGKAQRKSPGDGLKPNTPAKP